MSKTTRTILILTATLLFSLLATQALLFIHLLCEEHHAGHDSHECPICQRLLTNTRSATVEEQTTIARAVLPQRVSTAQNEIKPSTSANYISESRAPPFVC